MQRRWYCELAMLMPDHTHLLVSLPEAGELSCLVGDWKRWTHLKLGLEWQRNFFDHRIRREESLSEKADYILQNPVRAGLVERAQDWSYVWMPPAG
jgi:REP element-mobilizing transposase RayT